MRHAAILTVAVAILSLGVGEVAANQPMASVSGYVYDSHAKPVGEAFVEFTVKTEFKELVSHSTRTDETGKYRIERPPAGDGWAKATAAGRGYDTYQVKLEADRVNIINFKL